MRRIVSIFACICLLALFAGLCFPLPGKNKKNTFDEKTAGIVDVILRGKEEADLLYRAVGPGQRIKNIDPFESDPLMIYRVEKEYEISEEEIRPRVTRIWLKEENGTKTEITPAFQRILELTGEIDHDILETYILQQDEHLFAAVELNVNLWWPCVLYYYDADNDALAELVTHDAQDYIGLRIRNLENIDAAP